MPYRLAQGKTDRRGVRLGKGRLSFEHFDLDQGQGSEPSHLEEMSTPFIFKCPATSQNVQGQLDEDAGDDEYEPMTCPACTRLHFFNRKTGKILGQDSE